MARQTGIRSTSTALLLAAAVFCFALLGAAPVLAINVGLEQTAGAAGYQTSSEPQEFINVIIADMISQVLSYVGVLFLLLIVIAGVMWMTAAGNEEKIGKAKKLLSGAVIGAVIVFSAYAVTSYVIKMALTSTSQTAPTSASQTPTTPPAQNP